MSSVQWPRLSNGIGRKAYVRWECFNYKCGEYDGWGSEHSCRGGDERLRRCMAADKAAKEGSLVVSDD